jgi:predicted PhzF superfamily epimerase YddE/YHI9
VDCAKIEIFTTKEELTFTGHPTIGSSWFLVGTGNEGPGRKTDTSQTKAETFLQDSGRIRIGWCTSGMVGTYFVLLELASGD